MKKKSLSSRVVKFTLTPYSFWAALFIVSNAEYYEPVTKAIEPLIDSYYQANDCAGMINFLNQCAKNQDVNKAARECAFAECIPYYDGKCGERIMGDIINGIINDKS